MKSIKIKLNHINKKKKLILDSILSTLEEVTIDYLSIRLKEIESKNYASFKEHYRKYRNKYPVLNSAILQNHLRNIDSVIKNYILWCKKKHKLVSFPKNIKTSIPLRNDLFHFEENKTTKEFDAWLRFLRINFPLKLCDYHKKCLLNMTRVKDSTIIKYMGELYLRLVFETRKPNLSGNKVIGIDLGIIKPIVCSDGKQIGSGKYIKHKKIEFGKKRSKNQSKKQKINGKQSNWTNDLNHKLSRELIDYCLSQNINVLCLEKLTGNHLANKRFRRYSWAFKDLLNKINYKAPEAGLKVISVDPRYTSQTCSSCGLKEKSNRKSQSLYECSCGAKMNADINAAKNIYNLSVIDGLM